MKLELPYHRNCLVCLMLQIFGMLKWQNNLWAGPKQPCVPENYRDNKTVVLLTTGLKFH